MLLLANDYNKEATINIYDANVVATGALLTHPSIHNEKVWASLAAAPTTRLLDTVRFSNLSLIKFLIKFFVLMHQDSVFEKSKSEQILSFFYAVLILFYTDTHRHVSISKETKVDVSKK